MKLIIVLTSQNSEESKHAFIGDCIIRLGRHGDNDLVFDGSIWRTVSGFHAEIQIKGRDALIIDTNSTNGVLVNGHWIERASLLPGDIVELGKNGPSFKVMFEAQLTDPPPVYSGITETEPLQIFSQRESRETEIGPEIGPLKPFRSYPVSRANTLFPYEKPVEKIEEKKYGEKTVGMMIRQVLEKAGLANQGGTSKSTDYFEALVDRKVKKTSLKLKIILAFSMPAVLLLILAALYYFIQMRPSAVFHTTQIGVGDSEGQSIAAANRFTIFMLVGKPIGNENQASSQGFCTAFAVARDILATNAHCVALATSKFGDVTAIMNGAPANKYRVLSAVSHSGYVPGRISPDVGLLRIQGYLSNLATIASAEELSAIAPGSVMFLYGFPGRLNREDAPEATFVKGDIGRVTTFEQRLGNFGENTLLQHSAFTSGGTSGSPIFNTAGRVIGINSGGYVENGQTLTGYNFAMRIDLINELLPAIRGQS